MLNLTPHTTDFQALTKSPSPSAAVQVHSSLSHLSLSFTKQLQTAFPQVKFLLIGDSPFESCCVDDVSARHIGVETVVHIGYACGCTGAMKSIQIYEEMNVDVTGLEAVMERLPGPVEVQGDTVFRRDIQSQAVPLAPVSVLYVAAYPDSPELRLYLHRSKVPVYVYLAQENRVLPPHSGFYHFLSSRMTYIDMARSASIFGLLITSIPVYQATKSRLLPLLHSHNKEYYLLYIGKVTPQKLMNFPDIDLFIRISCPFAKELPARDYFKPVITPWEFELSLSEDAPESLELDYRECMGKTFIRGPTEETETAVSVYHSEAAVRFSLKSYKGLEETEQSDIEVKVGKTGLPQHYTDEG